ncbi:MAG: hypothetical protein NTV34_08095, partial [Proteobacteria bacterium]|nr:hypothetical protein [Pseudomonadota bacterium]
MLSILKFIRFKMLMILLCLLSCKAMKENGSSASKDTIDNQKIDYKQYDKCIVEVVTFTDGDSAVDRWCDSKGFGTHKFKRGFEGERDYLVKNSIKDLKAVGFIEDHKTTRSFNSFGWWRNQSGFQKHPHHVTQSTFSQVLKDVNVCLVYRDHLPNREFFIHC